MTRIMISIWLAAGILSLALPAPALAQTQITTAVIEGVVVDASGAVLPGVDVEVRNVDTNFTRSLTTDRDGRFVALQVPPGRYTVTFSLAGFATLVQEDVLVTVGESMRLNASMKVSGVAETVTVTTQSPVDRCDAHGRREHAGPEDDRDHANPWAQVRGPAHADARCQHLSGSRR